MQVPRTQFCTQHNQTIPRMDHRMGTRPTCNMTRSVRIDNQNSSIIGLSSKRPILTGQRMYAHTRFVKAGFELMRWLPTFTVFQLQPQGLLDWLTGAGGRGLCWYDFSFPSWLVTRVEQPVGMTELSRDDEQCAVDQSYLHLSAVSCNCCPKRFVSLKNARNLCECHLSNWRGVDSPFLLNKANKGAGP